MNLFQFYFGIKHFIYRKVYLGIMIPRNHLVLDIGSGDKPFWRADAYIDDLKLSDYERAGSEPTAKLGLFIDADAEKIPFEDETFDFVFCSHLLEHVNNPGNVIEEILRVTKPSGKGYIECPSALTEIAFPFSGHQWMIFPNPKKGLDFVRISSDLHNATFECSDFRKLFSKKITWNGYKTFIQKKWTKRNGIQYSIYDPIKDNLKYEGELTHREISTELTYQGNKLITHKKIALILRKLFIKKNDNKLAYLLNKLEAKELKKIIEKDGTVCYLRH